MKVRTPKNLISLVGKRFGSLKVIYDCGINTHGSRMWYCLCDCGKTKLIRSNHLTSGSTKSCGCLRQSMILEPGESAFNTLLLSYQTQAKKRNLKFNLTKEEFRSLTKGNCFYCGDKPSQLLTRQRANGFYIYNGIDRIDSKQGYTMDNCVSSCGVCNVMKMAMSQHEFLEHIKKIYNNTSVSSIT